MEALVLVAYATKYGSTEETARMVGKILEQQGLKVEVRAVEEVTSWKPYSAVVLAAALYIGRLHKHARRFLQEWRQQLAGVPVALLVPGPVDSKERGWQGAQQQLDKELARLPWLHPVACKIVGGKWSPAKLSFPFSWTLKKIPASDARDWHTIAAWAHEVAAKLQPMPHVETAR